jgi:hydroxyacylglutathione hydrolase
MSRTPGHDYPRGTVYQPDEPPLQLTMRQLRAARDASHESATRPGSHVFDDFIVYNSPSAGA